MRELHRVVKLLVQREVHRAVSLWHLNPDFPDSFLYLYVVRCSLAL